MKTALQIICIWFGLGFVSLLQRLWRGEELAIFECIRCIMWEGLFPFGRLTGWLFDALDRLMAIRISFPWRRPKP